MANAFRSWCIVGVLAAITACSTSQELRPWEKELAEQNLLPTKRAQPEYPKRVVLAGLQGCVTTAFDVRPDGRTDNFQVLDSKPKGVFSRAAVMALRDWRYPEREEPARIAQTITFSLRAEPEDEVPECLHAEEVPEKYLQPGEEGPLGPARTRADRSDEG